MPIVARLSCKKSVINKFINDVPKALVDFHASTVKQYVLLQRKIMGIIIIPILITQHKKAENYA